VLKIQTTLKNNLTAHKSETKLKENKLRRYIKISKEHSRPIFNTDF